MKKILSKITLVALAFFFSASVNAQTAGTLTFTFTELSHSATYNGNAQHTLAAWIQTSTGAFVKTKLRYFGGGTSDHLPTWVSNSASNIVDATTGATATAWKTYTVSWDGKKGAAATGTLQPDGVYKVTLQSTWNHGTSGTSTTSYTFTKGANVDHQTPAANTTFSNVILNWQPSIATAIEESAAEKPVISVYPNPTNSSFNIDYSNAGNIRVMNTLGVIVYEEKVDQLTDGSKNIDLSKFANGIYIINVSNDKGALNHKVILNK